MMNPDRRSRARARSPAASISPIRKGPSSDDAHDVVFFRRHRNDDPAQRMPGREFLNARPTKVRATMRVVLAEVAAAPPKRFAGGGYWEAIKAEMTDWFEVRVDGPSRRHYRLFCRLDYQAVGVSKPLLVVIDGREKALRTELSAADYRAVRAMGEENFARNTPIGGQVAPRTADRTLRNTIICRIEDVRFCGHHGGDERVAVCETDVVFRYVCRPTRCR